MNDAVEDRNAVAHAAVEIDDAAALRYLDACHQLLRLMKAPVPEISEVKRLYEAQRHTGVHVPQPEPIPPPSPAPAAPARRDARSRARQSETIEERLLDYVQRHPDLDDDELARNLAIQPRQSINQAARRLADRGLLRRYVGPRGKIVNRAEEARR